MAGEARKAAARAILARARPLPARLAGSAQPAALLIILLSPHNNNPMNTPTPTPTLWPQPTLCLADSRYPMDAEFRYPIDDSTYIVGPAKYRVVTDWSVYSTFRAEHVAPDHLACLSWETVRDVCNALRDRQSETVLDPNPIGQREKATYAQTLRIDYFPGVRIALSGENMGNVKVRVAQGHTRCLRSVHNWEEVEANPNHDVERTVIVWRDKVSFRLKVVNK